MRYRVTAVDEEAMRVSQEPVERTWEGDADDRTDAIMESGFDEDSILEVEELKPDADEAIAHSGTNTTITEVTEENE